MIGTPSFSSLFQEFDKRRAEQEEKAEIFAGVRKTTGSVPDRRPRGNRAADLETAFNLIQSGKANTIHEITLKMGYMGAGVPETLVRTLRDAGRIWLDEKARCWRVSDSGQPGCET